MDAFPAIGAKVKMNAEGHKALGPTRVRDPEIVGIVQRAETMGRRNLVWVEWSKPITYVEQVALQYLELAP